MTFKEQISQDMKEAMKAGRKLEVETLRSIRAGILNYEKSEVGYELTPEDELAILTSAAKKRKEAVEQYKEAGRTELAETEAEELAIISKYLPEQLSDEEVRGIIRGVADSAGVSDMKGFGRVMGQVMKEVKGKADGALVQRFVKEILGGE